MEQEQVRSFVAIELSPGAREELGGIEARLKVRESAAVKWVNPSSIHLTLKFLGSVAASQVESLIEAVRQGAQGIGPFHLRIGRLGVFPGLSRVQVVWVGLAGDLARLAELQNGIEAAFGPLGFPRERENFVPHLTLGRVRSTALPEQRQKLGKLVAATDFEGQGDICVDAVSLVRSELRPEGAIYTNISRVCLAKPLPST